MTTKRHAAGYGSRLLLVLAALPLAVTPARAAEVWLSAGITTKTLPGSADANLHVGLREVHGLVRLVRRGHGAGAGLARSRRRTPG